MWRARINAQAARRATVLRRIGVKAIGRGQEISARAFLKRAAFRHRQFENRAAVDMFVRRLLVRWRIAFLAPAGFSPGGRFAFVECHGAPSLNSSGRARRVGR
jgi:hypothetical protein